MGSISVDEMVRWEKAEGRKEERILVSVRLRPLNAKEIARHDPPDWDCINNNTIIYKNSFPDRSERSLYPTIYTFDRVFGCDCNTRHVYNEGAREVALSVVNGINSSIFAYGQTSSGKTYTMTGITEYAVKDIYDYIKKHKEREFVLKFSAMEIYNEAVRDLLSNDSSPLRLLDDAERGTVVEKLSEETLRDQRHLKELLSFCAAQRQVGETSQNETSSRSHQILRLTIESTPCEFLGKGSSNILLATVNFVDLAGSERSSQVSSGGTRQKEGCHINRSLLTLGTVIRKLSKGRTGHIPYRDSKLTRILQPFLGGNARTAIICTMSPARSHIEQSRNTLSFAICAKQVVTNAQVNVMMSDKALVKHLQKELSRLENELKHRESVVSANHSDVLKDKDAQIKKMEQAIKDLMQQRNFAHSQLDGLLRAVVDEQTSRWEESSQSEVSNVHSECEDSLSVSGVSGITYQFPDLDSSGFGTPEESNDFNKFYLELSEKLKLPSPSISSSPALSELIPQGREEIVEATYEDSQDDFKELSRIGSDEFNLLLDDDMDGLLPLTDEDKLGDPAPQAVVSTHLAPAMEQSIDTATRTTSNFVKPCNDALFPMPSPQGVTSRDSVLTKSRSCKASLMNSSILSWLENAERDNKTSPNILEEFPERTEGVQRRLKTETLFIGGSQALRRFTLSELLRSDDCRIFHEDADTDDCTSISGMNDMEESQYQKELPSDQETQQTQLEADGVEKNAEGVGEDAVLHTLDSSSQWPLEFNRKQQEIIELWHSCNVPLVHRSCFFLLFKGDPADAFYMEVECRRLSFLKKTLSHGNAGEVVAEDGNVYSLASSTRQLRREREMLYREMWKKLSSEERERLYAAWGIALHSKQRRLQLARRLWSRTDLEHVRQSALLVAKLIGYVDQGRAAKEMFGLSFTPQRQPTHRRSFSWKHGMFSLLWTERGWLNIY